MSLTDKVKEAVYKQTTFLSGMVEPTLEELLSQSKSDRRVRNVTPLYALFYERDKWLELTQENKDVSSLQTQFKKALVKLENSNSEASLLAKQLKETYFPGGKTYVLVNRNDTSEEMAKLLQSLVRGVKLSDSLSEEKRKSVEDRLKNVNFNKLFVSKENLH